MPTLTQINNLMVGCIALQFHTSYELEVHKMHRVTNMNKKMTPPFTLSDVEIISRECLYKGYFSADKLQLRHKLYEGGWSKPLSRELFLRGHAVGILLYDIARDAVCMVEQFRVGAIESEQSPWLLELVAGVIDTDETPQAVAIREAWEEAHCTITEVIPMLKYWPSVGACTETMELFCGLFDSVGVGGVHGLAEEGEDIRVVVISREEAYKYVKEGIINNAASIIALQWLELNKDELRKR
jgi:ADP-ribose pyrophosphatase